MVNQEKNSNEVQLKLTSMVLNKDLAIDKTTNLFALKSLFL